MRVRATRRALYDLELPRPVTCSIWSETLTSRRDGWSRSTPPRLTGTARPKKPSMRGTTSYLPPRARGARASASSTGGPARYATLIPSRETRR